MMNPAMRYGLLALLLVLAVGLVYSHALDGPFVLDDTFNIVENSALHTLWPISVALNPPPGDLTFCTRPFVHLTMCVDYARWGLNPRGYRLTNIAFHLAAVLVLFALLMRLFPRLGLSEPAAAAWGFAVALLWAVHPLATSAVNYLSQRGELAIGLFLFLMLYGLDRAAGAAQRRGAAWGWLAFSALACLLGMGSKENMLVAPLLALAYDRVFLSPSWREILRRRGGYYLALAVTALWPIHRHLLFSPHVQGHVLELKTWWRYLSTQAWGLNRFIRLVIWPHPLIFDYGNQLAGNWHEVLIPISGLVLLFAAMTWALLRHPAWGFLGLGFFALLAPSVLLPVTGQPLAEHRLYAPLAFALVLLTLAFRQAARAWRIPGRATAGLVAAAALILGGLTFHRNRAYQSELALLNDTLTKWPFSARAFYNRGFALQAQGDLRGALADYDRAIEIGPPYVNVFVNRARIHFDRQEHEAALLDIERALSLKESAFLFSLKAQVLSRLNRWADALVPLEQAARLSPGHPGPLNDMAWLLATSPDGAARDGRRAVELAEAAVRLNPGHARLHATLAAALAEDGRYDEAVAAAERALALARKRSDEALAAALRDNLSAYRSGRPWRIE